MAVKNIRERNRMRRVHIQHPELVVVNLFNADISNLFCELVSIRNLRMDTI
jgi:hypothetical protein